MDAPPDIRSGPRDVANRHGRVIRYLISGIEAQKVENIVTLFEALSGRKATLEEIEIVARTLETQNV